MKNIIIILSCSLGLTLLSASGQPKSIAVASAGSGMSAAPLGSNAVDHGGKIESKYDGFNRETVVALKKMKVTCGGSKGLESTLNDVCVSIAASLHCPGVQLDYVRYAKLQLIFESKNWDRRHPLDERELLVVADGETLKLGRMALASQALETTQLIDVMREILEVPLSYKTFNKIVRAESVEMRVGKTPFALRPKNMDALRDLNNRVNYKQR